MRKAHQPARINTLIIPAAGQLLLGRNGLIQPQTIQSTIGHFWLTGGRGRGRVVLSPVSLETDGVVIEGEQRTFWLPHPFEYDSFLAHHRDKLEEGVDYIPYASVGLYCVRNSPKGRLFEAAITRVRQLLGEAKGDTETDTDACSIAA